MNIFIHPVQRISQYYTNANGLRYMSFIEKINSKVRLQAHDNFEESDWNDEYENVDGYIKEMIENYF